MATFSDPCPPSLPKDDELGLQGLLRSVEALSSGQGHSGVRALSETELGMRANRVGNRHSNLESVLADNEAGMWMSPHSEMGLDLPPEYRFSTCEVPPRLCNPAILYWPTDLLFYIFYTVPGDALQMVAAHWLFNKGWRYSKSNQLWIARYPNQAPTYRTSTCEKGIFQLFDPEKWSRVSAQITVHYEDLEGPVEFPSGMERHLQAYFQQFATSGLCRNFYRHI